MVHKAKFGSGLFEWMFPYAVDVKAKTYKEAYLKGKKILKARFPKERITSLMVNKNDGTYTIWKEK